MLDDLTGRRYGMLTVDRRSGTLRGCRIWLCKCDCGNTSFVRTAQLNNGQAASCGCQRGHPTHGHTRGGTGKKSPTYSSWQAMNHRCSRPSNPAYAHYRSLGVEVCERWQVFTNFLSDMGERPSMEHTIDRFPNKIGNYEPSNCRWATKREQANNRVTNVVVEYKGEKFTMAELSRHTGLSKELLRHRICRAGWPVELAVSEPKHQGLRRQR